MIGVLLLASAALAGPHALEPPECWGPASSPGLGHGYSDGARIIAAPSYPNVLVARPRLIEHEGALWMADVDRLLRHEPGTDAFVTEWTSETDLGTPALLPGALAFLPFPEDASTGAVALDVVPLEPGSAQARRLVVDVHEVLAAPWGADVRAEGRRWYSPAGLAPSRRLDQGDPVAYLLLEFPRSREVRAAVIELALGETARVRRSWPLPYRVDRQQLLHGRAATEDLLLLVDSGSYLRLLRLGDDAALSEDLDISDATALAPASQDPAEGAWIGRADGCVTRLSRTADGRDLIQDLTWCAEGEDGPWPVGRGYVEVLAESPDGALMVSLGPDPAAEVSAGPTLSAFRLEATADGWHPLPVAASETLRPTQDGEHALTTAPIGAWYEDSAGRAWGAFHDTEGGLSVIQRFDRVVTPTPELAGAPVWDQVPFGAGAAVRTEEGGGALRFVRARPRLDRPIAAGAPVLAIASDGRHLWALVGTAGGPGALRRWDAPDAEPILERSIGLLPDRVEGFWWDGETLWLRAGGRSLPVEADGRVGPPVPEDCAPPAVVPGLLDGERICARSDGWHLGETPVVPGDGGAWWRWKGGTELVLEPVGGGRSLGFPSEEGLAPLWVEAARPEPVVLAGDARGVVLLARGAGPERLIERGGGIVRRDLPRACRDQALDPTRLAATAAFVDRTGTSWFAFTADRGGERRLAVGPALGEPPVLAQSWRPWRPSTASPSHVDGPSRSVTTVSCATSAPAILSEGSVVPLGESPLPLRRCAVSATNVFGTGRVATTFWHWPPRGLAAWGAAAFLAPLLLLRLTRRRRERFKQVLEFAQKANIPYVVGPPATGDMFFGRAALLEQFLAELRDGGTYILLADEKRIGKTSVLLRLARLLEERADEFPNRPIAIYLSMERCQQGVRFFRALWQALGPRVATIAPDAVIYEDPSTEEEAFANVLELLQTLHDDDLPHQVVLLLDEFQIIAGDHATRDARNAAQQLRSLTAEVCRDRLSWVAAGVASQLNPKPRDEDSDLLLIGPRYSLGHLEEDAARQLIREPIARLPLRFTPEAETLILAESKGHPFIIQHLCRLVVNEAALEMTTRRRLRRHDITAGDVMRHARKHALEHLLGEP